MPPATTNKTVAPPAYWSIPTEQLLAVLHSTSNGLSAEEAARRLAQDGPNVLQERSQATALGTFLRQFNSPIVLILLFATLISAVLGDWIDTSIILVIILGSATLSFIQEYRANSAAEKLRAEVQIQASVVRDGRAQAIPVAQVVPGDSALLSAGSRVPADGCVLAEKDLFVNQAVLTGESLPVEKQITLVPAGASLTERTNCVFLGTSVSSGTGRMLVVQTGRATVLGQVADRLTFRLPQTDFEHGIRKLGALLSEVILVLVLVVFAVRTRLPFLRSHPSRAMLLVTGIVLLVVLAIPYTPVAELLEFTPLPPRLLLVIIGIVALYVASAELVKRWFYAWEGRRRQAPVAATVETQAPPSHAAHS